MFQPLYIATATAHGGREGKVQTDDGKVSHTLSMPTSLGGKGGPGTNPEQLFAAGWSACYLGALRFVAGKQNVRLTPEAQVTAKIGLGQRDDGAGFALEATILVRAPGLDRAAAEKLAEAAHLVCPYSHATRGNIAVTTQIE